MHLFKSWLAGVQAEAGPEATEDAVIAVMLAVAEAGVAVGAEAGVGVGLEAGAITAEAEPTVHLIRAKVDLLNKNHQGIEAHHQNVGVDLLKKEVLGVPKQMAAGKGHQVQTRGDPQFCNHSNNFLVNAFPSVSGEKIRPDFAGRYGDDGG